MIREMLFWFMSARKRAKKCVVTVTLLSTIVLSLFTAVSIRGDASDVEFYFDPAIVYLDEATPVGTRFNVTVMWRDSGVPLNDVYAWEVILTINTTMLNCTRAWQPTWDPAYLLYPSNWVHHPPPHGLGTDEILIMGTLTAPATPVRAASAKLTIFELEIVQPLHLGDSLQLSIDNAGTFWSPDALSWFDPTRTNGKVQAEPHAQSAHYVDVSGPRLDRILIEEYDDYDAAMTALQQGQIDLAWPNLDDNWRQILMTDSNISVVNASSDTTFYTLDFNCNPNEMMGNPPGASGRLNPVFIKGSSCTPAYPYDFPPISNDVNFRLGVCHLLNRTRLEEVVGGSCIQIKTPMPSYMNCLGDYIWEECPGYEYNRTEAEEYFRLAGIKQDTTTTPWTRYWDKNNDGVAQQAEIDACVLRFTWRSAPIGRRTVGEMLRDELLAMNFSLHPTYSGMRNGGENYQQVMLDKNYHMSTVGWIYFGPNPDYLYLLYHISNYWDDPASSCLNTAALNDTILNYEASAIQNASDPTEASSHAIAFQQRFWSIGAQLPLFSNTLFNAARKSYTGGSNCEPTVPDDGENKYRGLEWAGLVNQTGYGLSSFFTFLNAHPAGYESGDGQNMTMRWGFGDYLGTLNPIYAGFYADQEILKLVYDPLLKRDPYTLELMPWIAKSYQLGTCVHPDFGNCSKISFSLRTDVRWSDGEPLTADDVRFSLIELPRIMMDRGLPVGGSFPPAGVLDFRIVDPYHFEILTNSKSCWSLLGAATYWILPEHVWRTICEKGDPTSAQPDPNVVGSGPWRIAEFVPGNHILLTKNPSYFKNKLIDCKIGVLNEEDQGYVVLPNASLEFNATITNQCYDNAANVTVQIYVDDAQESSTQVTLDRHSRVELGPFFTNHLETGLHAIRIVCIPESPAWASQFPSQYTAPIYATYSEDVNLDYYINVQDLVIVGKALGAVPGNSSWDPRADLLTDYKIDVNDYNLIRNRAIEDEWEAPQPQPGLARLVMAPNFTTFSAGAIFNATVELYNAIDLAGYQFTLTYNTTALDLLAANPNWIFQNALYSNINDTYSSTIGKYFQSGNSQNPEQPYTGNSPLVTLTFKAINDGSTFFNLTNTLLADLNAQQINHTISGGTTVIHDIAVSDVHVSRNVASPGDTIDVQVDVANNGDALESFWVTVYADTNTTVIGDETVIGNQTTTSPGPSSATLYFSWDTTRASPGNLTISAKAQTVRGETNATDNLLMDGAVQILPNVHDVAITRIRCSQEAVYMGDPLHIEVDVQNQGNLMEDINLVVYADKNTTVIGDEVVIEAKAATLERFGASTTTFDWEPATNSPAGNYTITAVAEPLPGEVDLQDNNMTDGVIQIFQVLPCPDVNVSCPTALTVNPSIFTYDSGYQARLINIGNVSIVSTGFEGALRVVGSRNGTIRLCVNQPDVDAYPFILPLNGEVQVPLWLMFQPETHWETYDGTFTLNLTVCGTHRKQLTIKGISITVCQNGAYIVNNNTATFTWNLTGGSLVYLVAEPELPPGWTYSVDPPIGTFFETPHTVTMNITAPPDAKEGEVGRVTLKAYKNETGVMIWQFIYFATTDNKPPTVESMETPVLTPDGHMLFNTTVKDASGIKEALLHYSVNNGPWLDTTMNWASGDTCNSTQYVKEEAFGTEPKTIQYYVSAVDWLGNETSTAPQIVSIMNDVAIIGISSSKRVVCEGYYDTLVVTIMNQGTLPLSFVNIALYANSTLIATQPTPQLQDGTSVTLNFSLALPKGSYVITAFATCLPGESNTANNAHSCMIRVSIVGDLTGPGGLPDGKVDVRDVARIASLYGVKYPDPKYDVNWDITGPTPGLADGKIDARDVSLVASRYGQKDP